MELVPARPFSSDAIAHLYRWEEIEGWRLLNEHFELMHGFALVVVLAPDDWAIALVREQMTKLLPGEGALKRVRFDPARGADSLAESLLVFGERSEKLQVVWIDADPASPDDVEQRERHWGRALAKLNRYRNTLQARFPCTLALALPSRFLPTLCAAAPDIWSIRSGVFRIEPPGGSHAGILQLPVDEWRSLAGTENGAAGDPRETLREAEKLRDKPGREEVRVRLLQRAGNQARSRLDWGTAQDCLQRAYALQVAIGGDRERQWSVATNLANVLLEIACYNRAEHYLREALQVAEQHFGPGDYRSATALSNLALVLQATNRLTEAEQLARRALAIDERIFEKDHPNIAVRLSNLAQLLHVRNGLAEAEPLMRRALAIDEKAHGTEHALVANRLNNLAQLLQSTGRLVEAEPLMRRALGIWEESHGTDHPHVATALNNFSALLQDSNRLAEAEPLMRRALAIDERIFGAKHPSVARDLNNLAQLLVAMNRIADAEPLIRRALEIDESTFGPTHPNIAVRLNNLAFMLAMTGRAAEAEPMLQRALDIDERSYGAEHPNVARDLNNWAQLLLTSGRSSEAEPLLRRALAIYLKFKTESSGVQPPASRASRVPDPL